MLEVIQQWDAEVIRFIQEHLRFEWLEPIMRFCSRKSNLIYVVILVLPVMFYRNWRKTLCFLAVMGICVGLTDQSAYQFKKRINRLRPNQMELPVAERRNTESFPSAHTANITGAFFIVRYFYPLLVLPMGGIAFFVISGRLFLNKHYPTDVLGGLLIGFFVSTLVLKILWPHLLRRFPEVQQWMQPLKKREKHHDTV